MGVISPPQMITNNFMIEIKQVTGYAKDAEVLMHTMVSTCPRVGARCYPPSLGITKEIIS